jgi:hypothetical protein
MSGILEKRPDGASRRQSRADKELKEKRKVRVTAVSVVAVLALLFAGAMFINSKYIRRTLPALTIGGLDFSAAEYDYYFTTAYSELRNQYITYLGEESAQQYLPSQSEPLSSQIYSEEDGTTWEDYFARTALTNMTNLAQLYDAAMADEFVLSGEALDGIDSQIASIKSEADMYSSSYPTLNSFLQAMYGNSMNETCLRKIMERASIATEYNKNVYDRPVYTPEQLSQYYSENADTLDKFIFRVFTVHSETVDDTDMTEDEAAAANEAALAAAKEQAEEIKAGITTEEDYINAAKEYDATIYGDSESTLVENVGSNLVNEYGEWLKDSARVNGDVDIVEGSSGTYVVFFSGRDKNEYNTVKMRQILIPVNSVDSSIYEEGEEDPEYLTAVETAETDAKNRADAARTAFIDGGATEAKFQELIPEYSSDGAEGGLYEKIQKGSMGVPALEDWLFDSKRQYGDYELIQSDSYGYHLVFFLGEGERSCDVSADSGLRQKDHDAWTESLVASEPVSHWALSLKQKH